MKNIYKFLTVFLFIFVFFTFADKARADIYIVHLFYNAKINALYFDKQQEAVSLDKNDFISLNAFFEEQDAIKDAHYILKIKPTNGDELPLNKFNEKNGQFDLRVPFFVTGAAINIYNFHSGEKVASTDISSFKICNGNGVCEYEKGENAQNCIDECASGQINYSDQTKKLLSENNGVLKDPQSGEILLQDKAFFDRSSTQAQNITNKSSFQPNTPPDQTTTTPSSSSSHFSLTTLLIIIISAIILLAILLIVRRKINTKKENNAEKNDF